MASPAPPDPAANSPPSLLDLPNELIERVASMIVVVNRFTEEELEKLSENGKALQGLRGACKRTAAICRGVAFQTVTPAALGCSLFSRRILPFYGNFITDAVVAGASSVTLGEFILFLEALPKLRYLALGASKHRLGTPPPPFLLPTPEYVAGEDETVTALRKALCRVRHLSLDKLPDAQVDGVLRATLTGLESLSIRAKLGQGCVPFQTVRRMASLKHLDLDGPSSLALLDSFDRTVVTKGDKTQLWRLESLSLWRSEAEPIERCLAFLAPSASTLRRLHLSYDFWDPYVTTPLFAAPFPSLTHLTLVDFLSPFLLCPALTPTLTHLAIRQDIGGDLANPKPSELFTKVLPTLLDNLPSLTHLEFDFNTERWDGADVMLNPTASKLLVKTCRARHITLSTTALFNPWTEYRDDTWWFCDENGQIRETGWEPYVAAETAALAAFTKELRGLVKRADDDADSELTRGLFELLRPLRERMQGQTEEEKRRAAVQLREDA